MLQSPAPVNIKLWTRSREIQCWNRCVSLRYDFYKGTRRMKLLDSNEIRQLRDVCVWILWDRGVYVNKSLSNYISHLDTKNPCKVYDLQGLTILTVIKPKTRRKRTSAFFIRFCIIYFTTSVPFISRGYSITWNSFILKLKAISF